MLLIHFSQNAIADKPLSPEQIIEKGNDASKVKGLQAVATLIIVDQKGRKRIKNYAQVSKMTKDGDTEKVLFKFLSPADVKGIGILTYDYHKADDDTWIYLPSLRKTRRIVSSQKSKSFMGSEFSYADTSRPIIDDFKYTNLGKAVVKGQTCWVIQAIPKTDDVADENGFTKKISWISKADFIERKADYYDYQGEIFKQLAVNQVKEIDAVNHKYKIMDMVMTNVKNNRKSIFKYNDIKFTPENNDAYFTSRFLEKGR
ncbi:MAG: outer membrane lipoprotein-sorting protein [Desulfobacter sp.]|nr:outer membrane lipoprotein-sorting protein [Desulfobacter sp.]WDP88032.1 MAG: outer membrane lipoprotein-sorting protein [Desulfobacter sp.]